MISCHRVKLRSESVRTFLLALPKTKTLPDTVRAQASIAGHLLEILYNKTVGFLQWKVLGELLNILNWDLDSIQGQSVLGANDVCSHVQNRVLQCFVHCKCPLPHQSLEIVSKYAAESCFLANVDVKRQQAK